MAAAQVDGNDVLAVRDAVAVACAQARAGDGPTFLEALTYRHVGHSRADSAAYRPPGELDRWRERDPIALFEQHLQRAERVPRDRLDVVRATARQAVADATSRALDWPEPAPAERFKSVWAAG